MVRCEVAQCPELHCPHHLNLHYKPPGECCSICANRTFIQESTSGGYSRGCTFGGKNHTAGSRFYPFLIPSGFDLCTECYCDPDQLEVKCSRKPSEKGCVSKGLNDSENGTLLRDELPNTVDYDIPYSKRVLASGGCKNPHNKFRPYENGQKYHPYIESLGEYKCVTCKCKVSVQVVIDF